MPLICYTPWNPAPASLDLIEIADTICGDYAGRGRDLTLRQLYYQFVARGHIPNSQASYKNLGSVINKARLAGLLDWDYINDRTRNLMGVSHWDTPGEVIDSAAFSYRLDKWTGCPTRVEVWVEKEALAGIIGTAARRADVAYFSCRGYVSQSELWAAARRHMRYINRGQNVVVLHLGDHDPSGIDMTRDITDRLNLFTTRDWADGVHSQGGLDDWEIQSEMADHTGAVSALVVKRIALNMDQILQYNPPPNPAKITDSRARDYIERFGGESWELDALDPDVLDALITDAIESEIDREAWDERAEIERRQRTELQEAARRWDDITAFLNGG